MSAVFFRLTLPSHHRQASRFPDRASLRQRIRPKERPPGV